MSKPILNQTSEKVLDRMVKNLPQSLLLTGEIGIGLTEIAKYIADLRGVTPLIMLPEKDSIVDLDKGTITVDTVRRLYDETKSKSIKDTIVIIDYAERMAVTAQNAFLKLLEEPNNSIYFMLLTHAPSRLLQTIRSRAETMDFRPVSLEQSQALLDKLKIDGQKRSQMLYIAQGLPAELTRLATDEKYFEKRSQTVKDARELLQGKVYQKLLIAHRYKDDRNLSAQLLQDAVRMLSSSLVASPEVETMKLMDKLINGLDRIEFNGNIRLVMASLFT